MQQSLLSVGIDLGTTTTQVIFSRIYLESSAMSAIPDVKITNKEVLYRSAVHFTPLIDGKIIDLQSVKRILQEEYMAAKIDKAEISTGAVIITGETARKENAEAAANVLAEFAGDFVVATAGPDLESVLAGCGAGAAELSRSSECGVVNYDIGGGTTNAALFFDGDVQETFALDIGGRLVRINEDGVITYVSERIKPILTEYNLPIVVGEKADITLLSTLADVFADTLWQISQGGSLKESQRRLFISGADVHLPRHIDMFSGGVAEFIYSDEAADDIESIARFGDIGPLLGCAIRKRFSQGKPLGMAKEKIRATVIGAGSHSLHISGSTVFIDDAELPLKNLPVIALNGSIDDLSSRLAKKLQLFNEDIPAISLKGDISPSYSDVKKLASQLAKGLSDYDKKAVIVLLEADFAKALGMTLQRLLPGKKVICLDKIAAHDGDYVDIGNPVSSVVPVVVKTLIFKA